MKIILFYLLFSNILLAEDIAELTVEAPRIQNSFSSLLEFRKQKNEVADVLGQESMTRSGDSDAASSLKRVTGLTLVDGKYVYVRGLGERYSTVLLNGSSIPSPEPSRRVVPLDLFPTSVLENIVVQKTADATKPSEFGGGIIELKTKSFPKKPTAQFGTAYNFDNAKKGIGYKGSSSDYLGYDNGIRQMPASIKEALKQKKKIILSSSEGVSASDLTAMTKELPNIYETTNNKKTENIPNLNFNYGDSWKFMNQRAGFLLGALYSRDSDIGEKKSYKYNIGSESDLVLEESASTQYSVREVQSGLALETGSEWGEANFFKYTGLLLRHTSDTTSEKISANTSDSFSSRKYTTLEWVERQLWLNQLQHHQETTFIDMDTRLNLSIAKRDAPDQRETMRKYRDDIKKYELEKDVTGNRRIYSELKDRSEELGSQFKIKILNSEDKKLALKVGANFNRKIRQSDTYRFHLKYNAPAGNPVDMTQGTEDIFSGNNGNNFQLTSITDAADSYTGKQDIQSYNLGVDYAPTNKWFFAVGVRQERSSQEVQTFKYYEPELPTSRGRLVMQDNLPSYNLTYSLTEKQKIRLGLSETLSRPDFRELSTVAYIDEESGNEVMGNNSLKGANIQNLDLRYENYFSYTDFFSAGAFYKKFNNPIESIFAPGDKLLITYDNAKSATNVGVETEARFGLRNFTRYLRRWSLMGNVSIINSKVELDEVSGNQTSTTRSLQGQSPYVANVQLLYDRPQMGMTSGLIYNVVGERITEVGTNKRPDVYEQPFKQLDLVFNQRIEDWGYGLKLKNILDPIATSTQGDKIVREKKKGRSYAVSFNAYF